MTNHEVDTSEIKHGYQICNELIRNHVKSMQNSKLDFFWEKKVTHRYFYRKNDIIRDKEQNCGFIVSQFNVNGTISQLPLNSVLKAYSVLTCTDAVTY